MRLYNNAAILFTLWFLAIFSIFYLGHIVFPVSLRASGVFLNNLTNWDGGHYLRIAKFGYKENFQYAFFPLYPLSIKILSFFTGNFLVSSLLISVISSFFALQILYKLINLEFSKKISETTIKNLLFFPTAFFLLTAYSEGLYLLLTVSSFYFFKKNNFLSSAIFAILASLTRPVGLALVLTLLIDFFLNQGFKKKKFFLILSPLGFLIYAIFLFHLSGDPFFFFQAQSHWQRAISLPWIGFWETIKNLSNPGFINIYFSFLWDLLFAIFGVGIVIRGYRFLPSNYFLYSFIAILIPLLTSSLVSFPRFLLPIFPIFIVISQVKNQNFKFCYNLISTMLLSVFAILFINGYWVS